jgi:hypothetical protein
VCKGPVAGSLKVQHLIFIYIFLSTRRTQNFREEKRIKKRESLSLSLTGESELLEGDWKMVALSIR